MLTHSHSPPSCCFNAANPAAIIALIDRVERAEKVCAALEKWIPKIEEWHPMNEDEQCVVYDAWQRVKAALKQQEGGE